MADYIPKDQLEHLMWKGDQASEKPEVPAETPQVRSSVVDGGYILLPRASTYAQGVHALQEASERDNNSIQPLQDGVIRPLTFKETLWARVNEFNRTHNNDGSERTMEERLKLFDTSWMYSSTGVVYKAGTERFKVVPVSMDLITIDADFTGNFLPIDYDTIVGEELAKSGAKYGEPLTQAEVVEHPTWLAAVEHDTVLLREYTSIVFPILKERYNQDNGMSFWVRGEASEDELRALFVHDLDDDSGADGDDNLNNSGSFLRVAQGEAP